MDVSCGPDECRVCAAFNDNPRTARRRAVATCPVVVLRKSDLFIRSFNEDGSFFLAKTGLPGRSHFSAKTGQPDWLVHKVFQYKNTISFQLVIVYQNSILFKFDTDHNNA